MSLSVNVQIDAPKVGLGVMLLLNGKPLTFVSKALTELEHQYASIKCEMLAFVFRIKYSQTYVYGHSFTIKSDQKPLEEVTQKNFADTPAFFQHMLFCPQRYDYNLK